MPFPNSNLEKHLDGRSQAMLLNMKLNPRDSDPKTDELVAFIPWFNTTTKEFKYYDGDRILTLQYLPRPVISVVTTLPNSARSGDRYLLKVDLDTAPEIHEYSGGTWIQEPFEDNESVFDASGRKYGRSGTKLESRVSTIFSDRPPLNSDTDYPLGQEWELADKAGTYKLANVEQVGTGNYTLINNYQGSGASVDIPNDTLRAFWQTFTPTENNGLDSLRLKVFLGGTVTHDFTVEVREGAGADGTLLSSFVATFTKSVPGFEDLRVVLPVRVVLKKDTQYTWLLKRNAAVSATNTLKVAIGAIPDNLPEESNSEGVKSLPFNASFFPTNQAFWVLLKDLIPIPEVDETIATVLGVVTTLPATATEGDRHILKADQDTAPEIHEYSGTAWVQETFEDNKPVFDVDGREYSRSGTKLERKTSTVVSDRDPANTDFDYKEGDEWTNLRTGEAFKLLRSDKDGKVLIGSTVPSTAANPSTRYLSSGGRQYFTPQVSGEIPRISVLFVSTAASFDYSLSLFKRKDLSASNAAGTNDELLETSPVVTIPELTTPAVVDFEFTSSFVESGSEYWVNFPATATAYYLERNQDLIPGGQSQITGSSREDNDFSVEIEVANPTPSWVSMADLIPKPDLDVIISPVLGVVTTLPATATKSDRYILKASQDIAPEIHEYSGTDWVQETFADKNSVFDARGNKYIRLGTRLEYGVSTVVANRVPTQNDNGYPIGQEWKLEDEAAAYKLLDLETLGASVREEDYGYTSGTLFKKIPATASGRYWQSFPVAADGGLEQIRLNFYEGFPGTSPLDHELLIELYEGVGVQGTRLSNFKRTITKTSATSNYSAFYFPTTLAVRAGETYTWAISRTTPVDDADNISVGFGRTGTDPLAGQSNDGDHDSYSFILGYTVWNKATWVKLQDLIPEVSTGIVQGILKALPIVTANGDRYIIKSDETDTPKIFEYNSGAWLQKPFEDKDSVYVRDSAAYYVRLGTRLERQVGTVVSDRAPVDTDIDYPVGQEWEWKAEGRTWKLLKTEEVNSVQVATWIELKDLISNSPSDRLIDPTGLLEVGNDYRDLAAAVTIKAPTLQEDGYSLGLRTYAIATTVTSPIPIVYNDDSGEGSSISIAPNQFVNLEYRAADNKFIQSPLGDPDLSVEDIGKTLFEIGSFVPAQGSSEFPGDAPGEIRTSLSTFETGIDMTNAEMVVITYNERLGAQRQFSEILYPKSAFNNGKVSALTSPYDTWHVNSTISNLTTGQLQLTEVNVNARLVSVKVYGHKTLKSVIEPGASLQGSLETPKTNEWAATQELSDRNSYPVGIDVKTGGKYNGKDIYRTAWNMPTHGGLSNGGAVKGLPIPSGQIEHFIDAGGSIRTNTNEQIFLNGSSMNCYMNGLTGVALVSTWNKTYTHWVLWIEYTKI